MRRFGLIVFLAVLTGAAVAQEVPAAPAVPRPAAQTPAMPASQPGQRQFDIAPAPQSSLPMYFGKLQSAPRDRILVQPGLGAGAPGLCLKLHKYVFRRDDGSDRMKYVGETYCTYGGHVSTRSAADPDPKPGGFGLYQAVAH